MSERDKEQHKATEEYDKLLEKTQTDNDCYNLSLFLLSLFSNSFWGIREMRIKVHHCCFDARAFFKLYFKPFQAFLSLTIF